ncbi:hypothetical protein [Clostridium sp. LP20]|uniref:hypothetical protein n=1 Tax=Clostridium sp. LP20 TaxID=3418665 RepID=UPI003EE75B53
MGMKITTTMRKKITTDWKELYPSMEIYKPMWLMNILGPLAVGVLLHIKSDKDRYIPTLHVHNLAERFPIVSLGIEITDNNKYISTISPEGKYKDIAMSLNKKALIPLEGDIDIKLIIDNLTKYCDRLPDGPKLEVFKYMLYIAGWNGEESIISKVEKYVEREISLFKVDILERSGGVDVWFKSLKESTQDTKKLREIVNQQIIELKLDKLPVRNIISQ